MTEMVAHVDDFDQVIDIVPREVAQKNGYNVRIAAVLVFNSKGQIVLQKISRNKKDAGKWNYSAAGHVNANEDYPTAALRELKEELGIDGKIEAYIGSTRTIDPITKQKKSFHRAFKVNHDGPYVFDKNEADDIKAFSKEELILMIRQNPNDFKQNLLDILVQIGIK